MNPLHALLFVAALQGPIAVSPNTSGTAFVASQEGRLEEARQLLAGSEEGDVNRGARICVELNSPESVELLLEILRLTSDRGLAAAHYRDISWGALLQIKDRYARMVVQKELNDKKASAAVRQWCAEILGLYESTDFGPSLIAALKQKEDGVRAAAARALGRIKYPPAAKSLAKRSKSKDPITRANAIEALALTAPEESRKAYEKGLADKDGGVRCALYATAPEAYPDEAEAYSTAALEDEDWRPRMQGLDNLAEIRTKTSVDALLTGLDDGRPAVAVRALNCLQKLTREKFTRADQWKKWWGDNRETFQFPEGRTKHKRTEPGDTVSVFNGIRLDSDHVAFLLDKSQKMNETLNSRGVTKDVAVQEELKGVFDSLQGRLVFNIFCYEMRVRPYSEKGAVKLTKTTSKKALEFHRKAPISGRKDIWAVLIAVMDDPELDTAYLLSSGEPDIGLYVHWNRVTYQLKELNRFHKVVFHTIAYSDNQWYRDQLEKIAEATGGEFKWFE